MKLTQTVWMFGIVATLLGSTVTQSFALPSNAVEYEYYSDAEFTNQVGSYILECDGSHYREGRVSRYAIHSSIPCRHPGPIEVQCLVIDRLGARETQCPADICNSGVFVCP
jgi:Family of unknown function (DUF6289)